MAVNVATLTARLEADIRDFQRDMKTADRQLDKLEGSTKKASKGMGGMGKAMQVVGAVMAGAQMLRFGKDMVMLAVSAEEAGSAFATTFGPAVGRASKFVEEFANNAGFAEFELQQLMATTGNIVQGLGATEGVSAELSESMARLAGDVASFSNAAGGAPAVLKALQSGLTGETEALKTYGIVINQADIQQQALLETGKEHADELTRLEKAQATLTIAYERAGKAVGDLDRTQESSANTLRRLNAKFKEAQTTIGKALLPVLEDLLPVAEDLIPTFEKIGVAVVQVARVIGPAGKAFGEWVDLLFNAEQRASKLGRSSSTTDKALGVLTSTFGFLAEGIFPVLQAFDLLEEKGTRQDAVAKAMHDRQMELEAQLYETAYAQIAANRATGDATGVTDDLADSVSETAREFTGVNRAIRNATSAMNEYFSTLIASTNPVFRAVNAWQDYQRSIAEATEDGVIEANEELGILQDRLEAIDSFASMGMSVEEGMKAIATASGLALSEVTALFETCLLYTSPSPRDRS